MACKKDVEEVIYKVVNRDIKNITEINKEGFAEVTKDFGGTDFEDIKILNDKFKEKVINHTKPTDNDLPGTIQIKISEDLYKQYIRIIEKVQLKKATEEAKQLESEDAERAGEEDNSSYLFQKKVNFNDLKGSKKNEVVSENKEVVDEVEDFSKENSKVLFNDKSKVTVDEVLDNIINNFNDLSPIGKALVTKAKNLKNKTGANVKFVKESVLETENTVMQIDAKTNTIEISKERLAKVNSKIAVESFLHELGHAQSLQALINPVTFEEKQFAELISKMFKWYSNLSNSSESYGFTNEAEFVSELYTNKAFQDEIRALDVEENT